MNLVLALGLVLGATLSLPAGATPPSDGAPVAPGDPVQVGQPAPDFTLPTSAGGTDSLAAHAGIVVLEWFNPDCPYVVHAYEQGVLPPLAAKWVGQGVTWLRINSGAPGKQGHGAERNAKAVADWGLHAPVLLDESGAVGQRYGARTTPHLFIVSDGVVVFAGGLDNAPRGEVDGDVRKDYVDDALTAVKAGQPVPAPTPRQYGCSVKYGS
ncbi:MAG: redoxin domain-containing protein [Alphaproteobacteria bacterium]|nr:redoxin domain-containing protein [Alphaproteobacteria bacterium]